MVPGTVTDGTLTEGTVADGTVGDGRFTPRVVGVDNAAARRAKPNAESRAMAMRRINKLLLGKRRLI